MNVIRKYWHWVLVGGIFAVEAIFLLCLNEDIYVGICDNLDLFITQLKVMKDEGAFFSQNGLMPMLQGIDRDYFPSEFSVYNLLYFLLPDVYAYIIGYLLKLVLAFGSSILLAQLLLGERYKQYEKLVVLVAVAFSLLPLYPMYGLCFASMPLILYLLIKIYHKPKWIYYVGIFFYPLVSYFTFFGAFILGYLLIATIILWIRDKKCSISLLGALAVLMMGFVCFEYRLFQIMLFSEQETIRASMVIASYDWKMLWDCFVDVFLRGVSHAKSVHTYFILPICGMYFLYRNITYIQKKQLKQMIADPFNLTVVYILFNCVVYALYFWEPLRNLVEIVLPPLKGFQYGRTIFFNTFAWYFAFFLVLKEFYIQHKKMICILSVIAIVIVGTEQCEYSDFYNTVYCHLYKLIKQTEVNQLTYGEFFASELFEEIKKDIQYLPEEEACAYGFHPAVLSYNGISTIDGYCGYYSQEYKEIFREVIDPVLDKVPRWQQYYDTWGCRAYLFSASGENTYDFGANADSIPQELLMDSEALQDLGCDYIFSRVEITNAEENHMQKVGVYEKEEIPYKIYLYKFK